MPDIATLKTLGQTAILHFTATLVTLDYTHPIAVTHGNTGDGRHG